MASPPAAMWIGKSTRDGKTSTVDEMFPSAVSECTGVGFSSEMTLL
jgi:hypothetical protein